MIGGQYRDVTGDTADLAALHRLKTGALFSASVGVALWVAEVPEGEQPAWRAFGDELGLLFQIVDDLLDGDGYAEVHGVGGRAPPGRRGRRARPGAPRRDRRGHERPRGDRLRARRPHGLVRPPPASWRRSASRPSPSRSPAAGGRPGAAATSSLKPTDRPVQEVSSGRDGSSTRSPSDGFRVSRLRGVGDGWCAWELVEGEHRERAWAEVIAVGERFHAALAPVPRPSFLDRRGDHWADRRPRRLGRASGGRLRPREAPAAARRGAAAGRRARGAARPRRPDRQRPLRRGAAAGGDRLLALLAAAGVRSAIVVGDALIWEGADERLLDAVAPVDDFPQLLVRALIFRAVVDALFRPGEPHRPDEDDCFLAPVELACSLAE